ncbi:MAG TPA: flagellin [Candidatus Methylacidiphilales bacterium]
MAVIGTNIAALSASNYLTSNQNALTKSIQRLSSGSRLADPSDDAAGVAVSGDLTARIARLQAAANGAGDVVSFAQTTDGFLSTIQNMLTRMSELAQEATNGAFGSSDRANYQTEYANLMSTVDNVVSNAGFNGSPLFVTGSIVIAINADGNTDSMVLSTVGSTTSLGINGSSINTTTAALNALTLLNAAISCVTNRRATVNADISKFNFYISNINTERTNVTSANSRIADLDVADESANLAKQNILVQASTSMLAQANTSQQSVLKLLQ